MALLQGAFRLKQSHLDRGGRGVWSRGGACEQHFNVNTCAFKMITCISFLQLFLHGNCQANFFILFHYHFFIFGTKLESALGTERNRAGRLRVKSQWESLFLPHWPGVFGAHESAQCERGVWARHSPMLHKFSRVTKAVLGGYLRLWVGAGLRK